MKVVKHKEILNNLQNKFNELDFLDIEEYSKAMEMLDKTYDDLVELYEYYSSTEGLKNGVVALVFFALGFGVHYLGV